MKTYTEETKQTALTRSNEVGVTKAARELNLYPALIYSWKRAKRTTKTSQNQTSSEIERLKTENQRLKALTKALFTVLQVNEFI